MIIIVRDYCSLLLIMLGEININNLLKVGEIFYDTWLSDISNHWVKRSVGFNSTVQIKRTY